MPFGQPVLDIVTTQPNEREREIRNFILQGLHIRFSQRRDGGGGGGSGDGGGEGGRQKVYVCVCVCVLGGGVLHLITP